MHNIQSNDDFENILNMEKALIFKNSTHCPISRRAKSELDSYVNKYCDEIEVFIVDVIQHKPIAMEIEQKTGIRHESPQAILLVNGTPVWNESHFKINEKTLHAAVSSIE